MSFQVPKNIESAENDSFLRKLGVDKLPDWITAISTATTAFVAIVGAVIAYVAYRRDGLPPMPVIEVEVRWENPKRGLFVVMEIVTRNQLYETVTVDNIRIKKPHGMTLAIEKQYRIQESLKNTKIENRIEPIAIVSQPLDWEIAPIGETSTAFRGTQHEQTWRRDVHSRNIYLSPPNGWLGGRIEIELTVSSKALTIRPRRITIKRQVPVAPKMQSAEIANNQS
jgi:hypothetical protein